MASREKYIVKRLLRPYLLMLALLLLLEIVISQYLLRVLEQSVIERNETLIDQLIENVESQLEEVEANLLRMVSNARFTNFLLSSGMDSGGVDVVRVSEMKDAIPGTSGDAFVRYALYCRNIHAIITKDTAYIRLPDSYHSLLHFGDMSYEQWCESVLQTSHYMDILPSRSIALDDDSERFLFIHSIDDGIHRHLIGQAMAYVETSALKDMMQPALDMGACIVTMSLQEGGNVACAVQEAYTALESAVAGRPSLSKAEATAILDEPVILTQRLSERYGLVYTVIVPQQAVRQQVFGVQCIMAAFAMLMLLIGGIIALISARHHSRPMLRLSRMLKLEKNDILQIDRAVSNLLEKQRTLEGEIEGQSSMLQTANNHRLVCGGFMDEQELFQEIPMLRRYSGKICGVVLELDETGHSEDTWCELACAVLYDELDKLEHLVFRVPLSYLRTAVCFNCTAESVTARLEKFVIFMREEYHIFLRAGIGESVNHFLQIKQSFAQATGEVDRARETCEASVRQYVPPTDSNESFVFGPDHAAQLQALALSGNEEKIFDLLEFIYQQNYQVHHINAFQHKLLLCALADTLLRQLAENQEACGSLEEYHKLRQIVTQIPDQTSPQEVFGTIRQIYARLCAFARSRKRSHNQELSMQIVDFLEKNFNDAALCLTSVSTQFGLNERYLSSFFREQTGESFNAALLRLRMEKAEQLLQNSSMTIAEIAKSVGYASVDTFRKAYKRYTGCVPSMRR